MGSMKDRLPADWRKVLRRTVESPRFEALERFVEEERRRYTVYPSEEDLFSAFWLTPYEKVKVLVLGQDPYHGPGQ
ncbi:MAG TPA: uracil-DNA glycosylase, partial [Myxococcaceae bacterium]|nr:uracil-DNA glycosylase [Myxococcaceae bacterium]